MQNNLRKLRNEKGLTQHQLADLAGLTQQQIQRAESGAHAVRVDVAAAISMALGATLGEVFPQIAKLAPDLARRRHFDSQVLYRERSSDSLDGAGIDADPEYWTVEIRLAGGRRCSYQIASAGRRRLESALRADDFEGFFCFDSRDHIVCIRLVAVQYIQLLWENAIIGRQLENQADAEEDPEDIAALRIHFTDDPEVETFNVQADEPGDIEDGDLDSQPLAALVMEFEDWTPTSRMVSFTDDNGGEKVYLNPSKVAIIEIPMATTSEVSEE